MRAEDVASGERVSDELVIDLVETLQMSPLDASQYCLQEYVDVVALERLIESSEDVVVHVTVDDVELAVSQDDVRLVENER